MDQLAINLARRDAINDGSSRPIWRRIAKTIAQKFAEDGTLVDPWGVFVDDQWVLQAWPANAGPEPDMALARQVDAASARAVLRDAMIEHVRPEYMDAADLAQIVLRVAKATIPPAQWRNLLISVLRNRF